MDGNHKSFLRGTRGERGYLILRKGTRRKLDRTSTKTKSALDTFIPTELRANGVYKIREL